MYVYVIPCTCVFFLSTLILSQVCGETISLAFHQRRYRPISRCNYLSTRREETGTKLKLRQRKREREREREREGKRKRDTAKRHRLRTTKFAGRRLARARARARFRRTAICIGNYTAMNYTVE